MDRPLRILIVDDDQDDFQLTRELLTDAFGPRAVVDWASSYQAGIDELAKRAHDACLLDYRLGAKTGLDLLRENSASANDIPIILLTGQGQREIDVQAMEAGAADFLTKESLTASALERAVRYAVERHHDRTALQRLNEMLESRVEQRTRELEEANRALQQDDRRKDEFIAVLAHELRNPLAPIVNALQLLEQCENDPETTRMARTTMERQLRQLVRLTDDLLEVSRISRGKIDLRLQSVDLSAIVEQAVEAARPSIEARKQRFELHRSDTPIRLQADPTRLSQVIGNLLNNASKFTGDQGHIALTVERRPSEAVVTIRDDGIGIAPEQLERIFDMFAQVDTSLRRSDTGLGIGLTLVRKLVELHAGAVEARSEGLGRGSEFIVRLPIESAPEQATPKPRSGRDAARGGPARQILVVDDNRDAAVSMGMLLQVTGHQVETAFCGEEAVAKAASFRPHLVLLDIGLPDFDGYEVARRLRAAPPREGLILVALTGWGQDADRRRSQEAGFDHHLVKPVEYATLMSLLASLPSPAAS